MKPHRKNRSGKTGRVSSGRLSPQHSLSYPSAHGLWKDSNGKMWEVVIVRAPLWFSIKPYGWDEEAEPVKLTDVAAFYASYSYQGKVPSVSQADIEIVEAVDEP